MYEVIVVAWQRPWVLPRLGQSASILCKQHASQQLVRSIHLQTVENPGRNDMLTCLAAIYGASIIFCACGSQMIGILSWI